MAKKADPKNIDVVKKEATSEEEIKKSVEETLISLFTIQQYESHIDRIRMIRGELPLEVQDLEDELVGLETRIQNFKENIENLEKSIAEKKEAIKESNALIKRYEDQQMNVRNNREYDSLSKEIEFQSLEIQLAEKRIKEYTESLENKKEEIEASEKKLEERKKDLEVKQGELKDIVKETEKEEEDIHNQAEKLKEGIEDRLILAYNRIRKNARNGLAVVKIERDACGGCFNKIPPQHQLDIKLHKKIIVCEYCGRILVDSEIADAVKEN